MPVPQENRLAGQEMATLVVRSVGGRHREIARALESVGRSSYRPLEVVLVYQGTDEGYLEYLSSLGTLVPGIEYRVAHNPTNEDQRARNLNIGIAVAKGRYVGFLDDDDALEPDHLERLVTVLQDTGRTWAYAQTVLKKENEQFEVIQETTPFVRKKFSLKALWTENFIPIHSFLIDRTRLHDELREGPFNEALTRSEDWDFLIRLGFYHEPAVIEAFTCSYYVSTAPRNSNLSLTRPKTQTEQDLQNKRMWDRSKEIVEGTKEGLLSRFYWARDYFVTAVAPLPSPLAEAPRATTSRFYRRVVLGIIRRLERTV